MFESQQARSYLTWGESPTPSVTSSHTTQVPATTNFSPFSFEYTLDPQSVFPCLVCPGLTLVPKERESSLWTSAVVQWLRIRLQGTQVPSPVWEDPICLRAPKPVGHY